MQLADFVIVGAMRCGTTSLYRYLGAHPEVFMVPKELGFFTEQFDNGLGWYEQQYADATAGQHRGEATADYLARNSAMQRLAATLPDAKLIASLRNPVDRAWSHYLLLKERGRETRTFTAALDDEFRTIAAAGPEAPGVIYTLHGLYDVHLERALALYPRGQVLVSIFERMIAEPEASYRALCNYVGIDSGYLPPILGTPVNRYVTFRSVRLRDLGKRLPGQTGRVVARLNTRQGVSNPPLQDGDRHRLTEFYADRITHVETLLGRPIPEWHP